MGGLESLHDALKTLELWTLDPEVRSSPELMDELLAEDFVEFGQSGRVYQKQEILDRISTKELGMHNIDDLQVRQLGNRYALLTYRAISTEHDGGVSNRSSIWFNDGSRWRMIFHQGTAAVVADSRE